MTRDEEFMLRCIHLASKGAGMVSPNPLVGSVVVHKGEIIGEGWHQKYGSQHAEVMAIKSVGKPSLLPHSTLYVNLEPCAHTGKTPPCAELIRECGIPRVVIGMQDPNEQVSGKGIATLRQAGIEVIENVMEEACLHLNKRFITYHTQKRPYVILKWAQTRDGFIAPYRHTLSAEEFDKKRHITGFVVQKWVHRERSREDAILVGRHTIETDNPSLNVRAWLGRNPLRITIDRNGKLQKGNYSFLDGNQPTLVFTSVSPKEQTPKVEYIQIDFDRPIWQQILKLLHERGIGSLIIEGGRFTLQSIIDAKLWDEIQVWQTPARLEEGVSVPAFEGIATHTELLDGSILTVYKPV